MKSLIPLVCSLPLCAQPPAPLVSPEVRPDHSVTFHLRAPNAQAVMLSGDFALKPRPLEKDEKGVWSVTIGPLDPDLYSYTFSVDGTAFTDPANPMLKTGIRSTQSLFLVPGTPPQVWEDRPVAHGVVHRHWYHSKALDDTREFVVYTPPQYDRDPKARFPVLYLLHGAGDHAGSWVEVGKANLILDNLLAEGKAKPMLVVMPFGHAVLNYQRTPEGRSRNMQLFEDDLLKSVMPEVEKRYRVRADRLQRAIAGLSMGGGQALQVGLTHMDQFAWVAGFSSAIFPEDFSRRFPALAAEPQQANRKLKLLWIGCGKEDRLLEGAQKFSAFLKEKDIRHEFVVSDGWHTWRVWRRYLNQLAPLLFQ